MRLEALHKKNLVKAKKIIVDSIMDHLVPQVSSLKTSKDMFDSLTKLFEEHKSKYDFEKTVEECEDPKCNAHTVILYKGLSNQTTTSSGRRRSGECRSGDSHLEWSPRIMGFIHSRNVCRKKVITFSRLWEE